MDKLVEYKALKNKILSFNSDGIVKTILISSSVHGEGCSTVAVNIAKSLSQNGALKICLIDANFKTPNISTLFGIENAGGLSNLAPGDWDIDGALKKTQFPNLLVIPAGKNSDNQDKILELDNLKILIDDLKKRFDYLIFDSPPINTFPDAHTLASLMDGVILVIYSEKTRWEVVQKAKEQLVTAGANILGVVLNRRKYVIPHFLYKRL